MTNVADFAGGVAGTGVGFAVDDHCAANASAQENAKDVAWLAFQFLFVDAQHAGLCSRFRGTRERRDVSPTPSPAARLSTRGWARRPLRHVPDRLRRARQSQWRESVWLKDRIHQSRPARSARRVRSPASGPRCDYRAELGRAQRLQFGVEHSGENFLSRRDRRR